MADEQVVLSGPPDAVTGHVPVDNATDSPITITRIGVDDPDDAAASTVVAVDEVTVDPGRRARIRLGLRVSPLTAPGSHPLELTVADTTITATVHVVEAPDLRVTPRGLVLDGLADGAVIKTVVVSNEGNVALAIPAALALPVHAEDRAPSALAALAGDGSEVLARGTSQPDTAGTLDVAIDPPGPVDPGTTRACACTFSLRTELPASERHLAALPLSHRTVLLVIPPTGTDPQDPG